jgi:CBS domain-containing protein
MLNYKAIEIFTSEQAKSGKKPVAEAVIEYIRGLKIPARCIVTRGIAGCYENGEIATGRLEILSYNLPIRIYIVLPEGDCARALSGLDPLVGDGIIALHDLTVTTHRVANAFFPRQLKVRDVMTSAPQSVHTHSPLITAVKMLLGSIFTGLPVVDQKRRPVGVITQGDLIVKGGLPVRLGLVENSDEHRREAMLKPLASRSAAEVMTAPPITIAEDRPLVEAVDLMLGKGVKRLPVVDGEGRLAGMLSRLDIFRTVMREAPDWNAFRAQRIDVRHLKTVADIIRRETHIVTPETTLDEVLQVIDRNDIQRVAVVDGEGLLLGLISDRDMLFFFKADPEGIWRRLTKATHPFARDTGEMGRSLAETTAGAIMHTGLITVREETTIEEAIELMVQKRLKRLPVIDGDGRFQGMVSRDSLLRAGFGDIA